MLLWRAYHKSIPLGRLQLFDRYVVPGTYQYDTCIVTAIPWPLGRRFAFDRYCFIVIVYLHTEIVSVRFYRIVTEREYRNFRCDIQHYNKHMYRNVHPVHLSSSSTRFSFLDYCRFWAMNDLDRDEVHHSVCCLMVVPHLARLSRPVSYTHLTLPTKA